MLFVTAVTACSSSNSAACDDSKCAAGNKCLALDGETKCRKTCSSNVDPASSCPFGYTCLAQGAQPFCAQDTANVTKKPTGQWGSPCNATGGLDKNPDCDSDQGFYCYGTSPTDANAYCTHYDCTTDRDCGATFYCGSANVSPNVVTTNLTVGQTQKVCLRRDYCAPCNADLDCPPIAGRAQHCTVDQNGGSFCAPECDTSNACNNEAKCVDAGVGNGIKTCYPKAGVCVGDGSICSPCRSDADCGSDGACVKGLFTTEHACAKKSAAPCDTSTGQGQCPGRPANVPATVQVYCLGSIISSATKKSAFPTLPPDYCEGTYSIGGDVPDPGCYSANRQ